MSRLTASPFHKPSPFHFPRPPLSPPDTNTETVGPSSHVAPAQLPSLSVDLNTLEAEIPPSESPAARFRRVSSLAYHSSGLRDPRDPREQRISHRSHRSFIVVIPPPAFLQEHGQLGHTLSIGPRHRLSQGLLMPLFPTVFTLVPSPNLVVIPIMTDVCTVNGNC